MANPIHPWVILNPGVPSEEEERLLKERREFERERAAFGKKQRESGQSYRPCERNFLVEVKLSILVGTDIGLTIEEIEQRVVEQFHRELAAQSVEITASTPVPACFN